MAKIIEGVVQLSVFVAKGEAAKTMNTSSTGGNYEWLRLKNGEKKRVMFLTGMGEFASYWAHDDYQRRINTHACLAPEGKRCPSCEAGITRRLHTVVLFWEIDDEKVLVWDTVKKHMNSVYSKIDEYPEDYLEMPFTIKRIGDGNQTVYDMSPIMRLKPEEKERAEKRKDAEMPELDRLVNVKKPEEMESMLAGILGGSELPETPESIF